MNRKIHRSARRSMILAICGVALLALLVMVLKDRPQSTVPAAGTSALPAAQVERARRAGRPALAFFHSNNCEQCLVMIETIGQVFPEFTGQVVLVDVNVYDNNNKALLQLAHVRAIPTLVFYDQTGQSQTHIGVMEAEVLRQKLSALAGDPGNAH